MGHFDHEVVRVKAKVSWINYSPTSLILNYYSIMYEYYTTTDICSQLSYENTATPYPRLYVPQRQRFIVVTPNCSFHLIEQLPSHVLSATVRVYPKLFFSYWLCATPFCFITLRDIWSSIRYITSPVFVSRRAICSFSEAFCLNCDMAVLIERGRCQSF